MPSLIKTAIVVALETSSAQAISADQTASTNWEDPIEPAPHVILYSPQPSSSAEQSPYLKSAEPATPYKIPEAGSRSTKPLQGSNPQQSPSYIPSASYSPPAAPVNPYQTPQRRSLSSWRIIPPQQAPSLLPSTSTYLLPNNLPSTPKAPLSTDTQVLSGVNTGNGWRLLRPTGQPQPLLSLPESSDLLTQHLSSAEDENASKVRRASSWLLLGNTPRRRLPRASTEPNNALLTTNLASAERKPAYQMPDIGSGSASLLIGTTPRQSPFLMTSEPRTLLSQSLSSADNSTRRGSESLSSWLLRGTPPQQTTLLASTQPSSLFAQSLISAEKAPFAVEGYQMANAQMPSRLPFLETSPQQTSLLALAEPSDPLNEDSPFVELEPEQTPTEQEVPSAEPSTTDESNTLRFPIEEFRLQGNYLFTDEELQAILDPFLGPDKTPSDLVATQEAIQEAYREIGYPLASINLPKRVSLDGVFEIDITEILIDQVIVTGNRYSSEDSIRAALPELEEGYAPNLDRLSRQLFLANDNPSRQLTLSFQPGSEKDLTNVEIKVEEQNPQRWNLRLDNTGTEATGETRLSLITQNSNVFNRGHLAAFSVTVSPNEIDNVRQFGLFYQAPIPEWGDTVNFSASYSDVNSGRVADFFDVSGQGVASGIHFLHNLKRTAIERQVIDVGLDYRLFKNTVGFFGEDLGVDVASSPLSIGYQYAARRDNKAYSAGIRYVRNIPGFLGRNDNQAYSESRAGADANWDLFEVNGLYQYTFPSGWLLSLQGEGQFAGEPLISGEQFGLGGARSVRGLEEREVAGDNGIRASLELYTPTIKGGHRFLAFTDMGHFWREDALPGEPESDSVWSVGLGWRWNYRNRLNTAVDLGYVLNGSALTDSGDVRLHFNVGFSF